MTRDQLRGPQAPFSGSKEEQIRVADRIKGIDNS